MTAYGNNNSNPSLRFPGNTGQWQVKTLGDVCDSILVGFPFKGQDITDDKSGHPILRAYSIGEGVIRHGKDYDKYYPHNYTSLERYQVKINDIVISMDGSVGRNIALVSEQESGFLLIQRVARLRISKYPIQLIYQQIVSQRFKDFAAGEKVGAVIAHISQKQIESFPVFVPSNTLEQRTVADCLSEVDNMISAQKQKVESLKAYKKGLMQQLFPLPGETTPRLRFPGFTGAWEVKPLSHYLHEHKTKSDGKCEVHSVSVTKGVINQVEYLGRSFAASDTSKYNLAKPGDIIYTKSPTGAFPYGIVKQNKNPYNVIVSPLYAVYTPVNQCVGYILDSFFESSVNTNNYLSSLIQKGAKNTIQISNDTFVSKSMCLPSNPAEQQKIAECLESFDSLIASETKKLESLKTHKRGLMQQLFPQPNK